MKTITYLKNLLGDKNAKITINKKNIGRIVLVNGQTAFNLDDLHGINNDRLRKAALNRALKASK